MLLVLADIGFGTFSKRIFFTQKTGKYYRLTYALEKDTSEVLIMGSSHANRHYVPVIFSEELQMSCYNAGVQGQQILFQNAIQKIILQRHLPKVIILNIDPDWMYESSEAYERLSDLHPYFSKNKYVLSSFFQSIDYPSTKLLSSIFQTNSTLVHVLKNYCVTQMDYDGYRPLQNEMKYEDWLRHKPTTANLYQNRENIENDFLNAFENFIATTLEYNIDLFLVVSPSLYGRDTSGSLAIMKSISCHYDIPYFDYTNDSSFVDNYNLYNDPGHLNHKGAIKFSLALSKELKMKVTSEEVH